jgi:hypothetical protein
MAHLKQKIKEEFAALLEFFTMKAVLAMKQKLVKVQGDTLDCKKIRILIIKDEERSMSLK